MNVLKPIYPHLLPQVGFAGKSHYKTVCHGNTDITVSRRGHSKEKCLSRSCFLSRFSLQEVPYPRCVDSESFCPRDPSASTSLGRNPGLPRPCSQSIHHTPPSSFWSPSWLWVSVTVVGIRINLTMFCTEMVKLPSSILSPSAFQPREELLHASCPLKAGKTQHC